MKKVLKTSVLIVLIAISGCQSEAEKIKDAQITKCREDIKSGIQPSQFCLSISHEFAQYLPQQYAPEQPAQAVQAPLPAQQYSPQAPVVVQAPPVQQDNGLNNLLIGGLLGHAMAGGGNGGSRTIINKTIVQRPAPAYRPAPVRPSRPSFSQRYSSSFRRR